MNTMFNNQIVFLWQFLNKYRENVDKRGKKEKNDEE